MFVDVYFDFLFVVLVVVELGCYVVCCVFGVFWYVEYVVGYVKCWGSLDVVVCVIDVVVGLLFWYFGCFGVVEFVVCGDWFLVVLYGGWVGISVWRVGWRGLGGVGNGYIWGCWGGLRWWFCVF